MKLSDQFYLIKLTPEAGIPTKKGIIFEKEVIEGIKCLLQSQEVNVVTGDPEDDTTWETIGSTVSGNSCELRGNALFLNIKLDEENPNSLKVVNDINMEINPSIRIENDLEKVITEQEDGTKIIHATGLIFLTNILFCKDS